MEKGEADMTKKEIQDDITMAKDVGGLFVPGGASFSLDDFMHLRIPLEDIRMATNKFSYGTSVIQGVFGRVYTGQLSYNGERIMVAVKRLDRAFLIGRKEFLNAIKMFSGSKHANLIPLLGFCDEHDENILVFKLFYSSLDKFLSSNALTWTKRLQICIGVARGMTFLHETQGAIKHAIKSSNILVDDDWNAKISNFQLDKFVPPIRSSAQSLRYREENFGNFDAVYGPEYFGKESNIYSFGVVLYEVLCGKITHPKSYGTVFLPELAKTFYEKNKLNAIIYDGIKDQISTESLEKFSAIAYQCLSEDIMERPPGTKIVAELEIALQCQRDAFNNKLKDDPTERGEDESDLKMKI